MKSGEIQIKSDAYWMGFALREARRALPDDVPVGAVVVYEGTLLAKGRNRREQRQDPSLHAEIDAIRRAARKLKRWHLDHCTLYVTLEPCLMCAGAVLLARMERVVFGALDPKGGALGSVLDVHDQAGFNHRFETEGGIRQEECATILQEFFRSRRGG
ncbi:MAG: tRNA adenosine(34) deaminase TadA [bacterium]